MSKMDEQLDALFAAYRRACPDREAAADFMPRLWRRIESRRSETRLMGRLASAFATAAATICLAIAFLLGAPQSPNSLVYTATYLETLASEHEPETLAYADMVNIESPERAEAQ